jgi:hypothetical protein
MNYIYLIQEPQFTNKNIYKLGKYIDTFNFPKNTIVLLNSICIDSDNCEKILIDMFIIKYKHYGDNYFEGNVYRMIKNINSIITNQLDTYLINDNNKKIEYTLDELKENIYCKYCNILCKKDIYEHHQKKYHS